MADNESEISLDASININVSQAISGLNSINKSLSTVTEQVSGLSSHLDKAIKVIEVMSDAMGKMLSQFSRSEIKDFSDQVAKLQNSINDADRIALAKQKVKDGTTKKNAETRQLEARNEKEKIAFDKTKFNTGHTQKEQDIRSKNAETNARRTALAEEKLRTGITERDSQARSKRAIVDEIKAATKWEQVKSGETKRALEIKSNQAANEAKRQEIYELRIDKGLEAKSLEIKATNAVVSLQKAEQGVYARDAETRHILAGVSEKKLDNEARRLAIKEQAIIDGTYAKELEIQATRGAVSLGKMNQGVYQLEAETRASLVGATIQKAENEAKNITLKERKMDEGLYSKELDIQATNANINLLKAEQGVFQTEADTKSRLVDATIQKAANEAARLDITQQKMDTGIYNKELDITATNATIRLEKVQQGVSQQEAQNAAAKIALNKAKFESGGYDKELDIKALVAENRQSALNLADKELEAGITAKELEIKAANAQLNLENIKSGLAQQKADTAQLNAETRNINAEIYQQELETGIVHLRERNRQLELLNKSNKLENERLELESGILDKNADTRRLEAENRTESLRQDSEILGSRIATEKAKARLYDAKSARANEDYRYEAGWLGGIASGIGGATSRARARSGLAGFAARVGTGVGQLNPGRNILKSATVSGLGLNPMTLAFSAVGAGIAKLTEGLGKLAVESLQAYGELDKLKTGLSVVFGSDTEANTVFEGIKEYSLESPFGVEQTTEMATLLKQSGVYGTELLDTMKMIGDTAGGNEEKFKRIANNYAQIASVGKASMLDMRQFAYAGIPIYKKVAEELGVSQSVLRQMISDGEVTNEVIEKVFKTMTSEGGEFYKAVERGAETLNARLVNLKDSMNMAKAGIGEWLFKLDIVGIGNSSDNQGSLGHLLNLVEELARKADDWATLRNIERDVNAISTRETVSGEIQSAIREAMLRGQDTTALQNLYNKVSGMDTLESNRDTYTQYNKYYQDIAERATTENYNNLQAQLEAVKDMDTGGKSREFKEWRKSTIKSLEDEIDFIKDYLPKYTEVVTEISPSLGLATVLKEFQGEKFRELQDALAITNPYLYQTKAQELSTRMFERGQKTASASSSLTSFAEQSRQKYLETEQGKAELEAKERAEYEKYARQFNSLRPLVDDTGNIIDDMRINIGQFVELMESGLIEPLEKVSVTWDALAVNTSDTTSQSRDKVDTWQGMASRADDISHLLYTLPMELQNSFRSIFDVLDKKDMNTKENVTELNKYMSDLENSQMFNANKNAQNLLQYLLTSNASVLSKIYSYDELKGKDSIPLWKRITGSALGVDAAKITNARDFYDTYTTQFQGRNISKGVISGMVDSGKSIAEITKLLRYTGVRGTLRGATQNQDTMQIDWVKTAEAMAQFALSTEATIGELESYGNAIEEQIGAYNELKKTMFTTGEDWDKLDATELAKQFENAFSGIGASMVATNAMGLTREIGLNENGEAIFKDTKELVSAQNEYQLSLENTAKAVDEAIDRLRESAVDVGQVLALRQTKEGFQRDRAQADIEYTSARYYREGFAFDPSAISETITSTINDLMTMDAGKLQAAITSQSASTKNAREEYYNAKAQGYEVSEQLARTDSEIVRDYSGIESIFSESVDMFDRLAIAIEDAQKLIETRSNLPDAGINQEVVDAQQFIESVQALAYSSMAQEAKNQKEGSQYFDPQALAEWGAIYAKASTVGAYDEYIKTTLAQLAAEGQKAWGSQLRSVDIYNERKQQVEQNVRNQLRLGADKKLEGASLRLYETFLQLAEQLGVVNPSLEEFALTLQKDYEQKQIDAKKSGDLAGYTANMAEKGLADYNLAKASGDKEAASQALGKYAGGQALGTVASTIQGTDVGAFVQGTMMGGPWVGLANMLLNAIAKVVGGMEVLEYAMNPVTNLLQGIAPYLKLIHLPLVVISRGLEMLGEVIAGWLTNLYDGIFGEGTMKSIDNFYASLTDSANKMEETAQRLEALNEMLDKTRQSIMEAEEYFLVQNRNANAQWAAQMQGQFVMDTRTQKVNDMILTPHGNFSTAPDDYILAMKDPASLMRNTGSNANVVVKFTVNNNASDVVETQTEERIGADGQKELMVTISRMVASDYASGRNGWDSAYSGRESRMKGRRVSR